MAGVPAEYDSLGCEPGSPSLNEPDKLGEWTLLGCLSKEVPALEAQAEARAHALQNSQSLQAKEADLHCQGQDERPNVKGQLDRRDEDCSSMPEIEQPSTHRQLCAEDVVRLIEHGFAGRSGELADQGQGAGKPVSMGCFQPAGQYRASPTHPEEEREGMPQERASQTEIEETQMDEAELDEAESDQAERDEAEIKETGITPAGNPASMTSKERKSGMEGKGSPRSSHHTPNAERRKKGELWHSGARAAAATAAEEAFRRVKVKRQCMGWCALLREPSRERAWFVLVGVIAILVPLFVTHPPKSAALPSELGALEVSDQVATWRSRAVEAERQLAEMRAVMKEVSRIRDVMGRSPLHLACLDSRFDGVRHLVACGANVDAKDTNEDTPLILAAYKGHLDIARLLLENGADASARNQHGTTALAWAKSKSDWELVRLLRAHGVPGP